ncbi:AcrR family transcriptional regulator [Catenulispora sp. GP43]|uniref:TetR/AcrR family transcriptional regulator n=1 Tax=Catenulispora sp. GP43 TaxID=3156263 RepID=UPI0035147DD3
MARLTAEERRKQLIGIGLRQLTERPIHELSLDEIGAEAGISRGLLFHYFPSKRDYYTAVVQAAANRLVRQTEPDPAAPPAEQLAQTLEAYLAFVERRRVPYLALFRGAAGGADYVIDIYERTRAVFVDRARRTLGDPGDPRDPRVDLLLHGWFGFVEDTVLAWTATPSIPREELLDILRDSLPALIGGLASVDPS